MSKLFEELSQRTVDYSDEICTPIRFDLKVLEDKESLNKLLASNKSVQVYDQIENQLNDLYAIEYPDTKERSLTLNDFINNSFSGKHPYDYGLWFYYPWKNTLIHLLGEIEFRKVRTIRNCYKITPKEQEHLSHKKIGIVGLSVGQSVALAIAMERIAGEIRIADYDTLELSNLNRIRTGTSNLGIKKTVAIAREISEIDPFLTVKSYPEGINSTNISSFIHDDGKLDLIIEECDSVEIKILVRQHAKSEKIPVLMDTSDRGMLDIERFDLNPSYPILHGLINESTSFEFLSSLKTSEDKLPFILPIIDPNNLSSRFKASGLEVGKTITTWPQLASDVILGGAICANAARRILLGEDISSGRRYIDLDILIDAETVPKQREFSFEERLSTELIDSILQKVEFSNEFEPTKSQIDEIIRAVIQAPSAGNNQKWKWVYQKGNLLLFIDKKSNFAFGDNLNIASLINCGCAIENCIQTMISLGINFELETFNDSKLFPLVGVIHFKKSLSYNKFVPPLSEYIDLRHTNRSKKALREISQSELLALSSVWETESSKLTFITDYKTIEKVKKLVCEADKFRFMNLQGHQEFFTQEIRWNEEQVISMKDGLDLTLLELSNLDIAGLSISSDLQVIEFLNDLDLGSGFERISNESFPQSSIIGIVTCEELLQSNIIESGVLIERLWLKATEIGIGMYPITVLPMMFSFLISDKHNFLSHKEKNELQSMRNRFHSLVPEIENKNMVFFFRLMISESPQRKSVRKSADEILLVR